MTVLIMSQDNKENKEFKVLINRLTKENESTDISNIQKMANIRVLGHALQNQSMNTRQENPLTCAILDHYLEQYHELTFVESKNTIATYREIWNDLSVENINAANWHSEIDLDSFNFDDCDSCGVMGITEHDLKNAFTKAEVKIPSINPVVMERSPSKHKNEQNIPIINPTSPAKKSYKPRFQPKKAITPAVVYNSTASTSETDKKLSKEFRTGLEEYHLQNLLKRKDPSTSRADPPYSKPLAPVVKNDEPQAQDYGTTRKYLGSRLTAKFIPPVRQNPQEPPPPAPETETVMDERFKNIDPKMIELIKSEIMDNSSPVAWTDIAGLKYAKTTIQEAVILPILRPDIFKGLRRPPRGILLFGPPGTGKTLLGKCIASQSKSTFFSISASSLTSKWIGDGEKMVRALFTVASVHQPAVVFIDEIDSLLCQRSESEHESSRRLKTEFLVQLDGVGTGEDDRILIIGATNRPQELDEAARRRLVKRLYIPLPELEARVQILDNLIKSERHSLTANDINRIGEMTEGYSGADMKTLCHEASMGPIRSIPLSQMEFIDTSDVRPLNVTDFKNALSRVRSSVSPNDLDQYIKWDKTYGSGGASFTGF